MIVDVANKSTRRHNKAPPKKNNKINRESVGIQSTFTEKKELTITKF